MASTSLRVSASRMYGSSLARSLTVSYTHLDVYKRQVQSLLQKNESVFGFPQSFRILVSYVLAISLSLIHICLRAYQFIDYHDLLLYLSVKPSIELLRQLERIGLPKPDDAVSSGLKVEPCLLYTSDVYKRQILYIRGPYCCQE